MENIQLASFDFDDSKMNAKLNELNRQIEDLNVAREQERKKLAELNKEYNSNAKEIDKLVKTGKGQSAEYDTLVNKQNDIIRATVRQRQEISDINTQTRGLTNETKQLNTILDQQDRAMQVLSKQYNTESRSVNELREDRKALIALRNQEIAVMGEQSTRAKQLNKLIADTTNQEKKLVSETEQRFYQIGDYAGQLQGNFQDLKDAILQIGSGNVTGGIKSLQTSVRGLGASMMSLVATPIGAFIVALAGIGLAAKYIWDYNTAVSKSLTLIRELTKETGESADAIRQQAQAIQDTYGKDFEETITNVKNLVKDFGLTYENAFKLYSEGLAKGGAGNKEFGDSINEYGVLFKQAGYSAQEFISLINAGFDLSIYSDKLPDAIKEAGISLNEQTKATRDALVNAFGATFSDDILQRVRTGQTSIKQALIEISEEAEKANLNQQQYAQLTADIFRGAGEDAGGAKIIFEAVAKSVDDLNRPLTELEQKTYDLQKSYSDLEKAKDLAFKSDDVIGLQKDVEILWNRIKTFVVFLVGIRLQRLSQEFENVKISSNAVIESFNDLVSNVKSLINAIREVNFSSIVSSWKDLMQTIGNSFNFRENLSRLFDENQAKKDLDQAKKSAEELQGYRNYMVSYQEKKDKEAQARAEQIRKDNQRKIDEENEKNRKKREAETEKLRNKQIEEAKKRLEEAKRDLETSFKMQEKYLQDVANLQFTYAQNELANRIKINTDKLNNEKVFTDEMLNIEKNRIAEIKKLQDQANINQLANSNQLAIKENEKNLNEINALKISEEQKNQLRLNSNNVLNEQLALNQQAFQSKELENAGVFNEQLSTLETNFYLNRKAIEEQRNAFDFEQKMLRLQNQYASESTLQMAELNNQYQLDTSLLREQLNNKLITLEQFSEASNNLEQARANKQLEIENILQSQKMSVIADSLGSISQLLGENSAAVKAFGLAQSLINTYQGITEVWKTPSTLPEPFATISKVGSTATVLKSGLDAVKQIKKVDISGKNTSIGGASEVSLGTSSNTLSASYAGGSIPGITNMSQISGYTQASTFSESNNAEMIKNAVKEGASMGTKEGSYSGSQQGMKDLSTDRKILNDAKY